MSKCVIVAAADFAEDKMPKMEPGDLLIAADGGVEHLKKIGLVPDYFIGDLDSSNYSPTGKNEKILPTVKDDTDMVAACRYAVDSGYTKLYLLGALGGKRISHTVANLQVLTWLKDRHVDAEILDEKCEITLLRNESWKRSSEGGHYFSLFSMTPGAELSIKNAKYPLEHGHLEQNYPIGTSNAYDGETEITVYQGDVLLILE